MRHHPGHIGQAHQHAVVQFVPQARCGFNRLKPARLVELVAQILPRDIVDKINAGVRKALEDPAVRKRIEDTGSIVIGNTPEQFAAQIKAEFEVYKKVVDSAKLKLD